MSSPTRHVTRCLVGGVVALLPIGGTVLGVAYLEKVLTESWKDDVAWYFPGLGIVLALLVIYVVGLFVTTIFGRWLWRSVDKLLERLPLLGSLYQSLKEVLGYDTEPRLRHVLTALQRRARLFSLRGALALDGARLSNIPGRLQDQLRIEVDLDVPVSEFEATLGAL